MKIGIISKTDTKIPLTDQAVKCMIKSGAEYIIHAGGIGHFMNLEVLKKSKIPYTCILSESEYKNLYKYKSEYNLQSDPYTFNLQDVSIKIMQYPYSLNANTDIIILSYTNIFDTFLRNNSLYINVDEISTEDSDNTAFTLLNIDDTLYTVTHYYREKNSDFWLKKSKLFKKIKYSIA